MSLNLTRFYFDFDQDCRTGCLEGISFIDIETVEADDYENDLKSKDLEYTRVDF